MSRSERNIFNTRCARLVLLTAGLFAAGSIHAQLNPQVMPSAGPLTKQTMARLLLTDVAREANRMVAVGDRGYIVYSDNDGETWVRSKAPAGMPLLNAVYFSDANTVWAVGHDSIILKSVDKGGEWTQAYASAKDLRPLMDILFTNANTGFAVGAYGAFYETTDAGKTWTSRKVIPAAPKPAAAPVLKPEGRGGRGAAALDVDDDLGKSADEDKHLNAIIKLGSDTLFIAGEAGTLLLSKDTGKTWTRITSPYKGSFFGAIQADDGAVLVLGLRGNVFRSADASLSAWTPVATDTKASMMGVVKLADGAIVLSGLSGTMLISRDNGKSFKPVVTDTIKPLAAAVPAGKNTLLVVGETGARTVALSAAKK